MNPLEDILTSNFNLEESHKKEGYEEGYNHDLIAGEEEGWQSAIRAEPTWFSARVQKGIGQMQELIEKYPFMDPENENVQEIMDALRIKFKVIPEALGVKLEYDGYSKPKIIEF
ncbi:hypothetical protein SLE2022_235460 [Rubroshorea leprosula]